MHRILNENERNTEMQSFEKDFGITIFSYKATTKGQQQKKIKV